MARNYSYESVSTFLIAIDIRRLLSLRYVKYIGRNEIYRIPPSPREKMDIDPNS